MMALTTVKGRFETAVHFEKTDDPARAREMETNARHEKPETGAFLLASWIKP
jgi:hypothetical protein